MKNLTIIIPIKGLNEERVTLLKRAFESIGKGYGKVIVVGPKEDVELAEASIQHPATKWESLPNDGDTSYPAQVMLALDHVKTDYFSVLEYDDEFTPKWFDNVEKYMNFNGDEFLGFLPLTEVIDSKTNEVIAYANEAFWASSFSEEIGYLDLEAIKDYFNFNTSGGVFKTKEFLALGGLKTSMKLVFWYEFLFRALYKEKKIFVVPKVGYRHYAYVDGCLTSEYTETMSEKEVEWWIDLAKKEYYFPQDRKKTYEE